MPYRLSAAILILSCLVEVSAGVTLVTSDNVDHKWPSLNNLGHIVWSQKVGAYWQVFKCIPIAKMCDATNTKQITSNDLNHLRPVISDDGTIIWFQDGPGGLVDYKVIRRDPSGSESVVEFSSRNPINGQHRDAGSDFGISSDSRSISYYTFFGATATRRFNVSGIGELKDRFGGRGDFYGYSRPDINKDLDVVYSGDSGGVYRAAIDSSNGRLSDKTIVDITGNFPRISDRRPSGDSDVVYVRSGQVYLKTGVKDSALIDANGDSPDVNNSGAVVFEKSDGIFQQIALAPPVCDVSTGITVNGHKLNTNQEKWVRYIASDVVPNFIGTREEKTQFGARVTWWSLSQGILGLANPFIFSNCNKRLADGTIKPNTRIGLLEVCNTTIWQVGIGGIQAKDHDAELGPAIAALWPGKSETDVLTEAIGIAGLSGAPEEPSILGSTGELRVSWLLRHPVLGMYLEEATATAKCLVGSVNSCYGTSWKEGKKWAPDKAGALRSVEDLNCIVDALAP